MRNIMNFLKITAVALTLLFSGTCYGSLTQWDLTSWAGSGDWMLTGYVQGDVDPLYRGEFVVMITHYRFEFTSSMGDTAEFVDARNSGDRSVGGFVALGRDPIMGTVRLDYAGRTDDSRYSTSIMLYSNMVQYDFNDYGTGVHDDGHGYMHWSSGRAVGVPEPSIIALFTLGLAGIGFARRRQS
jgi:hypothetical protein